MTRVFLVDDHAVLREGLRTLLEQEPDSTLAGEAANGQLLPEQLPTTPADVVLLDLNMPVLGGLATTQHLRADYPELRVIVLSMAEEPLSIQQALAAGGHGYLLKLASKDEMLTGIRTVIAEGALFMLQNWLVHTGYAAEHSGCYACLARRHAPVAPRVGGAEPSSRRPFHGSGCRPAIYQQAHRRNAPVEHPGKTRCKNTAALISYAIAQGLLDATVEGSASRR